MSDVDTSGDERRRNKRWPEALKREIVAATYLPGASVSMVARQYDVNANQVFAWPALSRSRHCACDVTSGRRAKSWSSCWLWPTNVAVRLNWQGSSSPTSMPAACLIWRSCVPACGRWKHRCRTSPSHSHRLAPTTSRHPAGLRRLRLTRSRPPQVTLQRSRRGNRPLPLQTPL